MFDKKKEFEKNLNFFTLKKGRLDLEILSPQSKILDPSLDMDIIVNAKICGFECVELQYLFIYELKRDYK